LIVHRNLRRSALRNWLIVSMSVSPAVRKEFPGICSLPRRVTFRPSWLFSISATASFSDIFVEYITGF
jgi:hypothetical protein